MTYQLKASMIQYAEANFLALTVEVNAMLDLLFRYSSQNAGRDGYWDAIDTRELIQAADTLGTVPSLIVDSIARWKEGTQPVLSRAGIEEAINELFLTLEVTMMFFMRRGEDMGDFSLANARNACIYLNGCNRHLTA